MGADRVVTRRWRVFADTVRTQLWSLPAAAVMVAVPAGIGLPRLDPRLDDRLPAGMSDYLFGGGADAARAVLVAVAGSLITVTALTFSLTVVTLQLASSQFSPRLLRTFTSDRVVQATLALFLATFVYALTVLRTVRTDLAGQAAFVPQLSVTVAYALTVLSVLALVGFLSHLVREIRIETMLRKVHREAAQTLEATLAVRSHPSATGSLEVPASAMVLLAARSGFLTSIDVAALLDAAIFAQACISIDCEPGSSLVAGTPVGRLWAIDLAALPAERLSGLHEASAKALHTGFERTAAQDIGYGLRQLTDGVVKALSPGINDPTTAVHALGHISALLCEIAAADSGTWLVTDEHGNTRVVLTGPDLADLLDLAIAQPRRYGAADPAVLARLLVLLRELAWSIHRPGHREAVADQFARIRRTITDQPFDDTERADLATLAGSVEDALDGRWNP